MVYLLYFLTAFSAAFLKSRNMVVFGDAVNFISIGCYIAVTLFFYYLFKPVNRSISMLGAILSLTGCAITALPEFHLVLSVSPLAFFGPYCLLLGYLILKSTFLPRFLGALMTLAGLGWIAYLLPVPKYLSILIQILGIAAEGLLMIWLIAKGVHVERWQEQARLRNPS